MKKHLFLWVIVITIAMVSLVSAITLTLQYNESEKERKALETRRDLLAEENERLAHDLEREITDEYIIALMRKLGYAFPGEKVLIYSPDTTGKTEANDAD